MARVIVGLPALARGPLLDMARQLKAPIMISAMALSKWQDHGPVPPGFEFNMLERLIRSQTGDTRPPTLAQKRRRARTWNGWNTNSLEIADDVELHIDSAGFVAMSLLGGYPFTPESYVDGLCTHRNITRFSSLDLCVEPEISRDRLEVLERISKTIYLNLRCYRLARDAGVGHKLMPVVQGSNADDYLRCFDAISGIVGANATIGVGSMCRRITKGPDGSVAIIERLDRELPPDVRMHIFGVKGDAAEAICQFGDRIDSVDSQSYGVRARKEAQTLRIDNPSFSKTNTFVADIMRSWYLNQVARMQNPRPYKAQPEIPFGAHPFRPRTVLDALEIIARAQFNDLIESGNLDHDQIVAGRMLEESVMDLARELPSGVNMLDPWRGPGQVPVDLLEQSWYPAELAA